MLRSVGCIAIHQDIEMYWLEYLAKRNMKKNCRRISEEDIIIHYGFCCFAAFFPVKYLHVINEIQKFSMCFFPKYLQKFMKFMNIKLFCYFTKTLK